MAKPSEGDALEDDISQVFYAALGKAISAWATVETGILSILQACLRKADIKAVAAVYYSVDNFRARAAMADAALRVVLKTIRSCPQGTRQADYTNAYWPKQKPETL
jgi:hypothetical protein